MSLNIPITVRPICLASGGLERLLCKLGIVSDYTLETLKSENHDYKILTVLVQKGIITDEEAILQTVAKELRIPYQSTLSIEAPSQGEQVLDLSSPKAERKRSRQKRPKGQSGEERAISVGVVRTLDFDFMLAHRVLPLRFEGGTLALGMVDPADSSVIQTVCSRLGIPVQPVLITESSLLTTLAPLMEGDSENTLDNLPLGRLVTELEAELTRPDETFSTPLVHTRLRTLSRLANEILNHAIKHCVSSILFVDCPRGISLQGQSVAGGSRELATFSKGVGNILWEHYQFRAKGGEQTARTFRYQLEQSIWNVELAGTPEGERRLRVTTPLHVLHDVRFLGMSATTRDAILTALGQRGKFLLVTTPRHTGLTTTLYALAQLAQQNGARVTTVEESIATALPGIRQRALSEADGSNIESASVEELADKPDVLLINRAHTAQEVSAVLAQLHPQTLLVLGVNGYMLNDSFAVLQSAVLPGTRHADIFGGILEVRAVATLCEHCARELPLTGLGDAERLLEGNFDGVQIDSLLRSAREPRGCVQCKFTGYRGVTALFRFVEPSVDLLALIASGTSPQRLVEYAERKGIGEIREHTLELLQTGQISWREFGRVLQLRPAVPPTSHETPYAKTAPSLPQSAESSTEQSGLKRQRILIIDDDEDVRTMIRLILENEFYHVDEAVDGVAGLEQVFRRPPDLVLCDLAMPRINGKEFVRRVRSEKQISSLPILMFTAFSDEETEVELLSTGADDFIAKTASPEKIIARVRRMLSKAS